MKLERDVQQARQVLQFPDEEEGLRLIRVLQTVIFSSGLATQLFLADLSHDGIPQDLSQKIADATNKVRDSFKSGDRANLNAQASILKTIVAQAVKQRTDVEEIHDTSNNRRLLRYYGD